MFSESIKNTIPPLCVDCDGTLIKTDILHESVMKYVASNPLRVFRVLLWSIRGKAIFKDILASKVLIAASSLPYNIEVLDYVKEQKDRGRKIILVTASHVKHANEVASFLNIFDDVFGTTKILNLKGENKADFLITKFGEYGFDYIGNSYADLPVWGKARKAILVGGSSTLHAKLRNINIHVKQISHGGGTPLKKYAQLIRAHQWAKNLILFIPLLTSHSFSNIQNGVLAFLSFSLTASSVYIINDLLDLDNDRIHHLKKRRPIAAGDLGIIPSVYLSFTLLTVGVGLSYFINTAFMLLVVFYVVVTVLYSFFLKRLLLIDTIILSLLYCLRLLAGHLAMDIPLSFWLMSFAIFFFFSLAMSKRFMELKYFLDSGSTGKIKGRGYEGVDLMPLGILGASSGVLSISIFSLYLQSDKVIPLYQSPMLLILLIPIFLYWISRVWILAYRGVLNEDPIIFALKDVMSYVLFIVVMVVIITASLVSF